MAFARRGKKQRVAVRRRAYDSLSGDIGAGTRPVFDDKWLPETLREPLTKQARADVGSAAGRK